MAIVWKTRTAQVAPDPEDRWELSTHFARFQSEAATNGGLKVLKLNNGA